MPPLSVGQKVFSTKCVTTRGIEVCVVAAVSTHGAIRVKDGKTTSWLGSREWYGTRQEAIRDALLRVQKALVSKERHRMALLSLQEELLAELAGLEAD